MKQRTPFYSILLFGVLLLFLPIWACKGEELNPYDQIDSSIDFEKNYNSILDYATTELCIEYDKDNLSCLATKPIVEYLYISDQAVIFSTSEDDTAITKNSRTYFNENSTRTVRVYGSDAFIQVDGIWWETAVGHVEPTVFEQVQSAALSKLYLDRFNPFKVYRVNAQDVYYSGAGDGDITSSNATWATCRAGTSLSKDAVDDDGNVYVDDGNIRNIFLPFDTSVIADDEIIDSATLKVYTPQANCNCVDSNVKFGIIESSATTTTGLYTTNWTPPSYDKLSTDKFCSAWLALNQYGEISYDLNASGTAIVDVTGITPLEIASNNYIDDLGDPSGASYCDIYYSEYGGTDYDPVLEITLYEEPPAEEPATTTIGLLYPDNMCINNDLSIICGMTQHYESTTTLPDWVEYNYYHVPFFVWFILGVPTLWIGNRLLIEFIIRWRRRKK